MSKTTCGSGALIAVLIAGLAVSCAQAARNGDPGYRLDAGYVPIGDDSSAPATFVPPPDPGGEAGPGFGGGSGSGSRIDDAGLSTAPCTAMTRTCTQCSDFPTTTVIDSQPDDGSPPTPMDAPSHFTNAGAMVGGPCLVEPPDGALIPQNWLRPRVRYVPATGQNLFEIRMHAARQTNDLLVYTTSKTWKLYKETWDKLRASTWDEDVTVTIRGVNMNDPNAAPSGTTGTFRIAPAGAGGSMIYWAAVGDKNGLSWLEGFNVGNETVAPVLTTGNVKLQIARDQGGNLQNGTGAVQCIGCHAAIPDGEDGGVGKSVAFVDFYPWTGAVAEVDQGNNGAVPAWLTAGGAQAFSQPWIGLPTFSRGDWASEHVGIASYGGPPTAACATRPGAAWYPWNGQPCSTQTNSALAWFDLSSPVAAIPGSNSFALGTAMAANLGQSYGMLARDGDSRGAEFPSWSHDAKTIVYVSTDAGKDGRLDKGVADLYSVPYNSRKGGAATPVAGAAEAMWNEFYPAYSPNDQFIAFNRAPSADLTMYYDPNDEVFVVPSRGGTPVRLAANSPPACLGVSSPGITNSWPKWSPDVQSCPNGLSYYWLIFSSSRDGALFNPANMKMGVQSVTSQLYLTGITVDATGKVTTYPALYIWNQPSQSALYAGSHQSNHTPVWEEVAIPPPPPPPPPQKPPT
ncbi:MAG: hypothetical protein M3O50_07480 [Myxococcota bacterium]|nr:hypothetical protein [Myxococcota bacterium]